MWRIIVEVVLVELCCIMVPSLLIIIHFIRRREKRSRLCVCVVLRVSIFIIISIV